MAEILARLRDEADVVIVDSPPVLPVADATILAAAEVQVLLIVQAGKTRVTAARRALDSLRRANAVPIGIVLNRAEVVEQEYHRYPGPVDVPARQRSGPRLRLIRRG
jgi:non-specific protein-tyrosine kinase